MQHVFRLFDGSDADYQDFVRIWNAAWPDRPITVEIRRFEDGLRKPEYFFKRYLAENEHGAVIGAGHYCETWWSQAPDQYRIDFATHPDFRRRGLGGAFYRFALDQLAQRSPRSLLVETTEDQEDAVSFLRARGYTLKLRAPVSELDLTTFERERWPDPDPIMADQGIRLVTLDQLQAERADWASELFDLRTEILMDMPNVDPVRPSPFDVFIKIFDASDLLHRGWIIAVDGDSGRLAGVSNVWPNEARPGHLETGLTGVGRQYRRRGIATAMKLRIIDFALEEGYRRIETDNEESNPMLQINLRLGFQPLPAEVVYRKDLAHDEATPGAAAARAEQTRE